MACRRVRAINRATEPPRRLQHVQEKWTPVFSEKDMRQRENREHLPILQIGCAL